jgi:hypothetical protein
VEAVEGVADMVATVTFGDPMLILFLTLCTITYYRKRLSVSVCARCTSPGADSSRLLIHDAATFASLAAVRR